MGWSKKVEIALLQDSSPVEAVTRTPKPGTHVRGGHLPARAHTQIAMAGAHMVTPAHRRQGWRSRV